MSGDHTIDDVTDFREPGYRQALHDRSLERAYRGVEGKHEV